MPRKFKKGYFVQGQFVAEGSELDLELKRELKGGDEPSRTDLKRESDELQKLGYPILVGASRKRFIAGVLDAGLDGAENVSNNRRDLATAVLTALLIQRELWGVRVHNVVATSDAIAIVRALNESE